MGLLKGCRLLRRLRLTEIVGAVGTGDTRSGHSTLPFSLAGLATRLVPPDGIEPPRPGLQPDALPTELQGQCDWFAQAVAACGL